MIFFVLCSYGFIGFILLLHTCGRRIFLVDVLTSIPLIVLICKVLANGLPARLSSGGSSRVVSFVLFCLIYAFCFFHS